MGRYKSISAASLLIVFALWAVATYSGRIEPLFLPTPSSVAVEFWEQATSGMLREDFAVSFYRILMGFVISSLFAVPIGMMMATSRTWQAIWEPFIGLVRYMPAVAFIPLSILWFGTTDTQKFFILFLGVFFQEVIMIADNTKTVNKSLIEVGLTLGFKKSEILRNITFRAALPGIIDTFRTTWGWAWTYLVVVEMVAANSGLGFRIMQAQRYLDTDRIILGILLIGLLGLITDFMFAGAYKKMFPWKELERAKG